jgi:hypothetical protein
MLKGGRGKNCQTKMLGVVFWVLTGKHFRAILKAGISKTWKCDNAEPKKCSTLSLVIPLSLEYEKIWEIF